ncbi:MAG: sodium-dependent transporter [Solobacterium sp.]|nr:sodium-dependent transporter [Solobacterium sp.]
MKRTGFGSRLGFIFVSAGCAIGIGNVWKFPYLAGENGGGLFVLLYLFFLLIMGIPVLTMELAVGRASRQSIVQAYHRLEPAGSKWHIHGWFCVIGCYILMMYYTTVSGWMLVYFVKYLTGSITAVPMDQIAGVFGAMTGSPSVMTIAMIVTVIAGFAVCSLGIQEGLERISKIMMSALLALILVLAVHSLTLSGAAAGTSFYLKPNIETFTQIGAKNVMSAAMNQAFFTLSIGIASMEVFGSYMSDDYTLTGEAVRICALDTFVAIMSGLIIFPACFSFGVEPDSGPSLIFLTLPRVFAAMPGGRIWGALFFLFMTFASFSTVITVFENLIAASIDNFGMSRKKAVVLNCIFLLIAGMPCVLGYNLWSGIHLIKGMDIMGTEDFLVSNLLLPAGSLIFLLFCVTKWGWGFDKYLAECNKGEGIKMPSWLKYYFRFILPVLILVILIQGLI